MKTVLIIGATSAIAEETAKLYAAEGYRLVLWARREAAMKSMEGNLKVLGAKEVHSRVIDLNDADVHRVAFEETIEQMGDVDIVLIAHGLMHDQLDVQDDFNAFETSLVTNYISYVSLLTVMAPWFEQKKAGNIGVITSVAGDRGRKSNYIYGSTKAGASAFTDGYGARMAAHGVFVTNIKPGSVATPMTAHLKQGLLFASPEAVAKGIVDGLSKNKSTVYVPGYWRLIMFIVRHIPEFIFKKLNF